MIIKSRRIGNIGKVENLPRIHLRSPSKTQKVLRRIVVYIAKSSKYKHIKLPVSKSNGCFMEGK